MDTQVPSLAPGGGAPAPLPIIQNAAPTTGQTVVIADTLADATLMLAPAGTLAALTVTLPTDAGTRIGQLVRIFTTQALTSLTINGATTIRNPALSAIANDCSSYQKVAANTWVRVL